MVLLDEQIENIQSKLQLLLKRQEHITKENKRFQKENEQLKEQLALKSELVIQLQHKLDAVNLNAGNVSTHLKKDLEKRINVYLKEIDKCLALLNT
jgi:uncharacterized phage infection (PIP) family protein YhgE